MSRRRTLVVSIAAVLLLAPVLSACTNPLEGVVEQGINDAVEGGIEGITGVDVEGGDELPADFPPTIPLVDGEVKQAGSVSVGDGTETNWGVSLTTDAAVADTFAQARTLLTDAGFDEQFAGETEGQSAATFTNAEHTVLLTVSLDGDTTVVNYAVTAAVKP